MTRNTRTGRSIRRTSSLMRKRERERERERALLGTTKQTQACRLMRIGACMHACIHTCMHTYIDACMHAYIHTYIHMTVSTFSETPPKNGILKTSFGGTYNRVFGGILKNLPVQRKIEKWFVPGDFLRFRQKRDYKSRRTKFKYSVFWGSLTESGNCHTYIDACIHTCNIHTYI